MGIVSSKLLKFDSKPSKVSAAVQTETPEGTTQLPDVRSPTADIIRTPIIVEKLKLDAEILNEYQSLTLRKKLLKTLKLDPRSPTVGIFRTPILIEDTSSNETSSQYFDSPVSIYSSNVNDSPTEDVMTPIEPSANVSGFEIPKEIYCGEFDITGGNYEDNESEENKNCLKVSDYPKTYESIKLLEEIKSDEEDFLRKVKMPLKKTKKSSLKNPGKNIEIKGRFRSPLSNITSSTNSPGNINAGMKLHTQNKVVSKTGAENSANPNIKHMVQWDQNKTLQSITAEISFRYAMFFFSSPQSLILSRMMRLEKMARRVDFKPMRKPRLQIVKKGKMHLNATDLIFFRVPIKPLGLQIIKPQFPKGVIADPLENNTTLADKNMIS